MNSRPKSNSVFTLYAPVTKDGWFDLDMLNEFCTAQLDKILEKKDDGVACVLDFKAVRKWDISVLLWLAIGLQYYRKEGLNFKLRLPEVNDSMSKEQYYDAIKSADYLKRWKFNIALEHVDSLERLMVPSQKDYFDRALKIYHETQKVYVVDGCEEKPESNKLRSIRDLSTFEGIPGEGHISNQKIEKCINEFHDVNVENILKQQCGLNKHQARSFASYLVGETLLNVHQHPGATSGFMAISKLYDEGELILAVVDNGDSIQQTIANVYGKNKKNHITTKNVDAQDWKIRADILDFATKPHVSSKEQISEIETGMGLTYVKEDAVDNFKGRLNIISQSVQVTYENSSENPPKIQVWPHKWPGNLIRISLPIQQS